MFIVFSSPSDDIIDTDQFRLKVSEINKVSIRSDWDVSSEQELHWTLETFKITWKLWYLQKSIDIDQINQSIDQSINNKAACTKQLKPVRSETSSWGPSVHLLEPAALLFPLLVIDLSSKHWLLHRLLISIVSPVITDVSLFRSNQRHVTNMC